MMDFLTTGLTTGDQTSSSQDRAVVKCVRRAKPCTAVFKSFQESFRNFLCQIHSKVDNPIIWIRRTQPLT